MNDLVAIVVTDTTGGPGLAAFRAYPRLEDAPCLLTPDGAIFFIVCRDIPEGSSMRLISKNLIPGVYAECLIGKRAAAILNWAKQFGNNELN
jgi:hypothetical protein